MLYTYDIREHSEDYNTYLLVIISPTDENVYTKQFINSQRVTVKHHAIILTDAYNVLLDYGVTRI